MQWDDQSGWRETWSQQPRSWMPSTSSTWTISALFSRSTKATMEWTRTLTWSLSNLERGWRGFQCIFISKAPVLAPNNWICPQLYYWLNMHGNAFITTDWDLRVFRSGEKDKGATHDTSEVFLTSPNCCISSGLLCKALHFLNRSQRLVLGCTKSYGDYYNKTVIFSVFGFFSNVEGWIKTCT